MKKIITLIAAAVLTISASAQIPFAENFSGNPQFTTSYDRITSNSQIKQCDSQLHDPLFMENTYAIVSNPNDMHSNFTSMTDHSTFGSKMMVVNGNSIQKSLSCTPLGTSSLDTVYSKLITGATVGSTYTLSFWAKSVNSLNPAKLSARINGEPLKVNGTSNRSYQLLGNPPSNSDNGWVKIYGSFKALSTSFKINVFDSTRASNGNDFAIDDIELIAGGTNVTSLPVKFGQLTGEVKGSNYQLNWNTYSETNMDNFNVQKSPNGSTWTTIGTVQATNSTNGSNYSFVDETSGNTLYRIESTDLNGTNSYSNVLKVSSTSKTGGVSVSPNPFKDNLTVKFMESDHFTTISIYNIMGQSVKKMMRFSGTSITIDVSALPSGQYTLNVINENESSSYNVVKQ